jgi:hypothetical protein
VYRGRRSAQVHQATAHCIALPLQVASVMYPPLDRAPNFSPCSLGRTFLGLAPLRELVAGQTYSAYVLNFLKVGEGPDAINLLLRAQVYLPVCVQGSSVAVYLRHAKQSSKLNNEEQGRVGTIETYGEGSCREGVTFKAPMEEGSYYMLAHDSNNGLWFGFSSALSVVSKATHPGRRW